jgi:hypothetical protein
MKINRTEGQSGAAVLGYAAGLLQGRQGFSGTQTYGTRTLTSVSSTTSLRLCHSNTVTYRVTSSLESYWNLYSACCSLHATFLIRLFFDPEDRYSTVPPVKLQWTAEWYIPVFCSQFLYLGVRDLAVIYLFIFVQKIITFLCIIVPF